MPALQQFRFNVRCILRDVARRDWGKIPFHWRGLKRTVTLTEERRIALALAVIPAFVLVLFYVCFVQI